MQSRGDLTPFLFLITQEGGMSPASLPMYIHTPYSQSKHDKKVY